MQEAHAGGKGAGCCVIARTWFELALQGTKPLDHGIHYFRTDAIAN
jgi:hypothetical protein